MMVKVLSQPTVLQLVAIVGGALLIKSILVLHRCLNREPHYILYVENAERGTIEIRNALL